MLIYNKNVSKSFNNALTIKKVHKSISKSKIISHVKLITNFTKKCLG